MLSTNRRGHMAEIICVGYRCPICKQQVVVLRSSDTIAKATDVTSQCECGFMRPIRIAEIQLLDVWRQHIP